MREPALLVFNGAAGDGLAAQRYARLSRALHDRFDLSIVGGTDWVARMRGALRDSPPRLVIAGGGDGTVSAVASELMELGAARFVLGAVGLGSSNDFHKGRSGQLAGLPVRIDTATAAKTDVVVADCDTPTGRERRHFIVSASCGATADANARFNAASGTLALWKRRAPNAAVLHAAARSVGGHRPLSVELRLDDDACECWSVSNLSLLKTPWLGGGLRYDTPIEPASGRMAVNMCHDMTRLELASLLWNLRTGHFLGRPKTWHRMARRVELATSVPSLLELDGELIEVTRALFKVREGGLLTCS